MKGVEEATPTISTMRRELEIKSIILEAVREGVAELNKLLQENYHSGKYKSKEEMKESAVFVALMEEYRRMGRLGRGIFELREKLEEVSEDAESAEGVN